VTAWSTLTKEDTYKMATLSLKISVVGQNVIKTMQFEPNMQVFDACRMIRDKLIETTTEKINRK
jgi:talin